MFHPTWQAMLGLIVLGLVLWLGSAFVRYQRSLIKPEGKDKEEWLERALQIAEAAERLINPHLWLDPYGPKLTPEVRKQHLAELHRHMHEYLRSEHISIPLTREQVLLLLAQRDLGIKHGYDEPAEEQTA